MQGKEDASRTSLAIDPGTTPEGHVVSLFADTATLTVMRSSRRLPNAARQFPRVVSNANASVVQKLLHKAASKGDLGGTKRALAAGAAVDSLSPEVGCTVTLTLTFSQ